MHFHLGAAPKSLRHGDATCASFNATELRTPSGLFTGANYYVD
jgi:hypothetical protein